MEDKAIRRVGPVVNLAAALAANAQVIYTLTAGAQWVGTTSYKLKKLMIRSNGAGALFVEIGTGVGGAFLPVIPGVVPVNNMDNEWMEYQIPSVEVFANLTAYPTALALGSSVDIQVEVEEVG